MPAGARYRWEPALGRYRNTRTGRFLPPATVRRALDNALQRRQARVVALGQQLQRGEITAREWQFQMRRAIKDVHLYSAAAAKGGWDRLTPADYGRVGQIVRGEYEYQQGFAEEIADGLPFDGAFEQRVRQYAEAGRDTFHVTEREEKAERGFKFERSIRGKDDSCDECVEEEAKGWQPIGEMRPIGRRQCLRNCGCAVEYSDSEEAA